MGTFNHERNRAPSVEVLSDLRLRVTRTYDIFDAFADKKSAQFLAKEQYAAQQRNVTQN